MSGQYLAAPVRSVATVSTALRRVASARFAGAGSRLSGGVVGQGLVLENTFSALGRPQLAIQVLRLIAGPQHRHYLRLSLMPPLSSATS